jgi:phosphofructokinase-like protein
MPRRIGVLTGGGDCPGLNPAIRGCVVRALDHGFECFGLAEGWQGLVEGKGSPLRLERVEEIVGQGGTILGTSRTNPFKKEGAVEKCLQSFKNLGLDAVIAMGGEDTLGVAARLYKERQVPVVGVPKTMDNDLSATDYTFGFDTATTIAVEAAERLKDTGRSHRRVMVLEVMGRHVGWVALFTAMASGGDWVCLPEEPVNVEAMCNHVKKVHARKGTALVITSEAVDLPGAAKGKTLDGFGHEILKERAVGEHVAEIIQSKTGIETRSAAIGHIQRGGPPTLFDRILGIRVGTAAADLVGQGKFGLMVALRGNDIVPVSLEEATAKLKTVTPEWLALAKVFFK